MSAETKAALDAAIAAHVADETPESLVTGYALIVSNATVEDFDQERTRYFCEYAEQQPFHVALGLIHRHRMILEQDMGED